MNRREKWDREYENLMAAAVRPIDMMTWLPQAELERKKQADERLRLEREKVAEEARRLEWDLKQASTASNTSAVSTNGS